MKPVHAARASANPESPVFIVGVGRSGTTLLANLLGCHPLYTPIYETAYLRNLLLLCERAAWHWGRSPTRLAAAVAGGIVRKTFAHKCDKYVAKCEELRQFMLAKPTQDEARARGVRQKYERFPFEELNLLFDPDRLTGEAGDFVKDLQSRPRSETEIYALARASVDRLFRAHAEKAGKPRWINKTPRVLLCLDLLPKLYPGANCIHILRDGRDVATSFKTLAWGPKNIRDAARRWKQRMEARQRVDTGRLNYAEIRYEDLIREPGPALDGLLRFLGADGDSSGILEQINVYSNRVGAWREAFSPENRRIFDREAGDLLIELGYERDREWVARA